VLAVALERRLRAPKKVTHHREVLAGVVELRDPALQRALNGRLQLGNLLVGEHMQPLVLAGQLVCGVPNIGALDKRVGHDGAGPAGWGAACAAREPRVRVYECRSLVE
jgi:hypothetical protein